MSQKKANESFKLTKIKDNIKTTYCEKNNVKLLRLTDVNKELMTQHIKLLISTCQPKKKYYNIVYESMYTKNMNNCIRHKTYIQGYSDTEQLAEDIGNLHYKTLCEFVYHLRQKLKKDANNDRSSGRFQLAEALSEASESLSTVEYNIEKAWDISRPFMETKND